jgi:hypothetical protein
LQAISIQIVQTVTAGWPAGTIASMAPVSFGLLLLVFVAIGMSMAAFVKVRPAAVLAGKNLPQAAFCRPLTLLPRTASAVRCHASHADCAPLRAPPTVLRTLWYRCFERTAGLSPGSANGDNGATSPEPGQAGPAIATLNGMAPLRALRQAQDCAGSALWAGT